MGPPSARPHAMQMAFCGRAYGDPLLDVYLGCSIYLRQMYFVRSLNSSCRVSKLAKLETLYLDEAIPKSSVSFVSPIPTENIVMPVEK